MSLPAAYVKQRPTRDQLVQLGMPLVRRMAYRLARRLPPNVDVGDLIGSGSEGLLKAIDSFDFEKYDRFEPYAEARIRGAILDELRGADTMTRHGRRRMGEVTRAVRTLERELGRAPEDHEIARSLGMELDAYHKLSEDLAKGPALARLGELSPDDVAAEEGDAAHVMSERQQKDRLVAAIKQLPERTQMVLALYYQEECTQAEIGEILGITESRVCQILGESSARLRAKLSKDA